MCDMCIRYLRKGEVVLYAIKSYNYKSEKFKKSQGHRLRIK